MNGVIVQITDRARKISCLADELDMIAEQIERERIRHNDALKAEAARYENNLEILMSRRSILERAIFQLGVK